MAIYTPRGLKIRITEPYAYALMARLEPRVSPFQVLKTTEGIESLPALFSIVAAIVVFAAKLSAVNSGLIVVAAEITAVLMNMFGFYVLTSLVTLGTLFSYVSGYGIFFGAVVFLGFRLGGWRYVLAFFVAKIAGFVLSEIIDFYQGWRYHRIAGHAFTSSEISFFNAYRIHALAIGATTDIDLAEEELHESNWGPTFRRFAVDWPGVVVRFKIE